ncbi:MAG: 4Fe-4S binding protein [Spirochaetes bacterium]|jgi:Fe-S-cluster-containing hydrogenase component 2|nr:4Fe-4S binding protein [Spirochaetota bacterium]
MINITESCPANHRCPLVSECPVGAIIQNGTVKPEIDREKCIDCGLCVISCPRGAMVSINDRYPVIIS